jgi:high-affinity iron transporter
MRKAALRSLGLIVAGAVAVGLSVSPAAAQDGKKVYDETCVPCHGATGKGDGPMGQHLQPKPADFATALKGKDEAYIRKVIEGGGAAVGKAAIMPAYKGTLSDDQIKAVVEYVKGFASQ